MDEIKLTIQAILNDKQFQDGVKGVVNGLKKAEDADKSFTSKFKENWLAITAALVAVGAVFSKIISTMKDMVEQQERNKASMNSLNEALKQNGEYSKENVRQIEAWTKGLSEATGIEEDEIRTLEAMAIKQGLNSDMAKTATQTAIGLSKALGIDQAEALKIVIQGHNGLFTATSRMIPTIRTMTDNTQKMAEINRIAATGLAEINNEMKNFTGASRVAGVQVKGFKEFFGELIEKALYPFIVVIAKVIGFFNGLYAPIKTIILITGLLVAGIIGVTLVIPPLTAAVAALGIAVNTAIWPVTLIVAAVAALAIGAVEIVHHWGAIKFFFLKLWGDISLTFLGAVTLITGAAQAIAKGFIDLINSTIDGLNKLVKTHIKHVDDMTGKWDEGLRKQITKQKEANDKLVAQEKDRVARMKEAGKSGKMTAVTTTGEGDTSDPEKLRHDHDEYLKYLKSDADSQVEIENIKYRRMLEIAREQGLNIEAVERQHAENMLKISADYAKQTIGGIGSMFTDLGKLYDTDSKKQFEANKAASIASATVSTYEGAVKAYTSMVGIPVVGPELGIAAAALAVAAGLKNIASIGNAQYAGKAAKGALIDSPSMVMAGESGPEMILPANLTRMFTKMAIGGLRSPVSRSAGSTMNDNRTTTSTTTNQAHITAVGMTVDDLMRWSQRTGANILAR